MTKEMQIALEAAARKLAPEERAELVELLFDTIEDGPKIDAAWRDEADLRYQDHQQSGASCT